MAEVEEHDVHRNHPRDLVVRFPPLEVLRDQAARPVEHPLEIAVLPLVLDLDDDPPPLPVHRQQVDPVGLVQIRLPVALALQQLLDLDVLAEQLRQEALQHVEVRLAAQQLLHRPVETYQMAHGVVFPFRNYTAPRGKNQSADGGGSPRNRRVR